MSIFGTKRRRIISVVLVVGIACAVPGFFLLRKTTPAATQAVAVEYADLGGTVRATGIRQSRSQAYTVRAKLEYTSIVAPIEDDVISLPVQEGQTVNAVQQAKLDDLVLLRKAIDEFLS